jgi:hypothetical protein
MAFFMRHNFFGIRDLTRLKRVKNLEIKRR